eukprot:TRINITY_DN7823_c0_g1_i2.p1 TRINITY_DN7823_c0_g1~~TRINITY_DN7823_c0_g1_i2.p1  ORF type:complete len:883 (-),score=165.00 TRINITY_DN7823_c0_g1_i2:145-2751(-)
MAFQPTAEHTVTFSLQSAETQPGEAMLVVGSHPELGAWVPADGLKMTTDEETYPVWTATASLSIPEGSEIEYKYVRDCMDSRGEYDWEEIENRKLALPYRKEKTWKKMDDGFGVPGTRLQNLESSAKISQPMLSPYGGIAAVNQAAKLPQPTLPSSGIADVNQLSSAKAAKLPQPTLPSSGIADVNQLSSAKAAKLPQPTLPSSGIADVKQLSSEKAAKLPQPTLPSGGIADVNQLSSAKLSGTFPQLRNPSEEIPETKIPSETTSEKRESASEDTPHAPGDTVNIPSAVSLQNDQVGDPLRCASFSCLGQLINDAEEMADLRSKKEEEWQCEFSCEEKPVRYGARHLNTPIVIVSSEMNPWSKTGGLAMIAASYGFEFALRGHRTMAISPMYADYEKCKCIGSATIELAGGHHEVRYFHQRHVYGEGKACDYIFVDHHCFRRAEGIYGPPGAEYGDNLFRFALFSLAATEAPLVLEINGSIFGQDVLFICNDWQTGILPVYLLYKYKMHNVYTNARSMMVIHNIGYQGKYQRSKYPVDSFLYLPPNLAGNDLQGEDMHMGNDCINLLAAGIRTADRVLTVSPNYAIEIQSPEGGHGLHGDLTARARENRLVGILNGISDEWSPAVDPHIAKNFRLSDVQEGKRACKEALQKALGLNTDPNMCLIGFCGRLCYQKGLSLFMPLIDWIMKDLEGGRNQMIIMGKGEDEWAKQVSEAEGRHRGRVCGYVGFDPVVEHQMLAGCDLLLMPSQYEPCGLPQMYAQMYGTLPVVHETGGLKDSVRGLWDEGRDQDTATGFPFCGFSSDSLKQRLCQAIWMFHHNQPLFKKMQSNAMKLDHYWPTRMDEYEEQVDMTMEGWPHRKPESWWTNHF